jgi:hypothetical protein
MKKLFFLFVPFSVLIACVNHDLNKTFDCSLSDLTIDVSAVAPATSCSTTDGSISVIASGGKQPYVYLLNDIAQPSNEFNGLHAGIYSVGVTDANGCDTLLSNIMVMAKDFSFTTTLGEDNLCLGNNGSVTVEVSEGNPPYQYKIDNSEFTESNIFTGLSNGNHVIEVRDNIACTISLNVTVPRGITGTSWSSDIQPIMEKSCALSGCHNGTTRLDLRIYSNAKKHAAEIKTLTRNRSMPFDGTPLTQNQIELISCWVDDGAEEN